MTTSVKDSIETLKKAQNFDSEIYDAQVALDEIPQQLAEIEAGLEREKDRLHELTESLKAIQLSQKDKEGQLGTKENEIKKLEGQLSLVKTNKEYSALQQEIASLKADNSLLEEEIIKAIDEVEAAEEEVRQEKIRLTQVEKEHAEKKQKLASSEKELKTLIEKQKAEREAILSQLDSDVRSQYDIIVTKKQGIALATIEGEICGACRMQLRPQIINELQMGETFVFCESCTRILYIEQ